MPSHKKKNPWEHGLDSSTALQQKILEGYMTTEQTKKQHLLNRQTQCVLSDGWCHLMTSPGARTSGYLPGPNAWRSHP